jgi:shikimate dehydrogenase
VSGRRAAVLGKPVRHSLSPTLHAAAYAVLGLDWVYDFHEVDEDGLAGFVAGLDERWAGLSLTMPLKRAAIPLCDTLGKVAGAVRAVNTLTFDAAGTHGENTDVPGLVNALAEVGVTEVPTAAVLGGGATAASAIAALAGVCTGEVEIYLRTAARAEELLPLAEGFGVPLVVRSWDDAGRAADAPLVISTAPSGAADGLAGELPDDLATLFDVVYDPWPTALAAAWAARGGQVLGGLDLLIHQAVLQVELMTGHPVPRGDVVAAMRTAGRAVLAERAMRPARPMP